MITFTNYITETFLIEMPYIQLNNNEVVDLELEIHSKMKPNDFINYMNRWLNGEKIQSKSPGFEMQINKNTISDFARKLQKNYFFKLFVVKNYGQNTWDELAAILEKKS